MELANDHGFLNYGAILKAYQGWSFDFCPSFFVSRDFEVGGK